MDNSKILTQETFDTLLNWLSPDREEAGEKYEKIRQGLLRFFYFKGCSNSEDLADETINRVVKKLPNLDFSAGNKPITIFQGFANNIYLEYLKKERREVPLEDTTKISSGNNENVLEDKAEYLEHCLQKLSEIERLLVLQYYSQEKSLKFEHRRNLATKLNLTMGAMHIKIHRIRKTLRDCIEKCLGKNNL